MVVVSEEAPKKIKGKRIAHSAKAAVYRIGANYLVAPVGDDHCHLVYKHETTIRCTCHHGEETAEVPTGWYECEHIQELRRAHRAGRVQTLDKKSPLATLLDKPLRRLGEIISPEEGLTYISWDVVVERLSSFLTYSGWGFTIPCRDVYSDPWMAGMVDEEDLNQLAKSDVVEVNGPNRVIMADEYTFEVYDAKEYKKEAKRLREAFLEEVGARQGEDPTAKMGLGIELMIEDPENEQGHPTRPIIVGLRTFMAALYA